MFVVYYTVKYDVGNCSLHTSALESSKISENFTVLGPWSDWVIETMIEAVS